MKRDTRGFAAPCRRAGLDDRAGLNAGAVPNALVANSNSNNPHPA